MLVRVCVLFLPFHVHAASPSPVARSAAWPAGHRARPSLPRLSAASSTLTGDRDEWRRRHCDVGGLARSETAQTVGVRILVRVAAPVTH